MSKIPFWHDRKISWRITPKLWVVVGESGLMGIFLFTSQGMSSSFNIVHWITRWCAPVEQYNLCTIRSLVLSSMLFITDNVYNFLGDSSILYGESAAHNSNTNCNLSWCDLSLLSAINSQPQSMIFWHFNRTSWPDFLQNRHVCVRFVVPDTGKISAWLQFVDLLPDILFLDL